MISLKGRQDGYRLLLPKEFIAPEIVEKYTKILRSRNSFYVEPIDFLNETIQKIQVLGITNGTIAQSQSSKGTQPLIDMARQQQDAFMYPNTDYNYRSETSPLNLIDRTINIQFRHTLGFLNYFLIFENFWYMYHRDRYYKDMVHCFNVDIFNEKGSIYSRIVLDSPVMDSMDMLDLDFTQPVAASQTFQVTFKYQNFDFQFLEIEDDNRLSEINIDKD